MYQQQGDVIIESVVELPKGAKLAKPGKRGWMLAEGETTGHAHTIDDTKSSTLYTFGGILFLQVLQEVCLLHEEHKKQKIKPGLYKIRQVQEYDHFAEEARAVRD